MDNDNTFLITINTVILIIVITVWGWGIQDKISEEINNINPIINEQICEEILPYKFRGRQYFVCYKGDSLNYSPVELEIIKEWKQSLE